MRRYLFAFVLVASTAQAGGPSGGLGVGVAGLMRRALEMQGEGDQETDHEQGEDERTAPIK